MSMSGTLERGAHHQALDLSEELGPPHPHQHHPHPHQQQHTMDHPHHHHQLHHSNSLASTTAAGNGGGGGEGGLGSSPPPPQQQRVVVVVPPPYSAAESGGGGGGGSSSMSDQAAAGAPLELRGSLDCWACSVLVTAQNLVIAGVNACLAGVVFGSILTPAIVMVLFGFLCHSTVRPHGTSNFCSDLLADGGCVALLVVGFLLVTPLLVLALAAYCRLARHLQLGLCFIPYSRAVYKNLPAASHRGLAGGAAGCCGGGGGREAGGDGGGGGANNKGKVWV